MVKKNSIHLKTVPFIAFIFMLWNYTVSAQITIFSCYSESLDSFYNHYPETTSYQLSGGQEFQLVHRPDISDSAYEFLFRMNHANWGVRINPGSSFGGGELTGGFGLTDSCAGKLTTVQFFKNGYIEHLNLHIPNSTNWQDTLSKNPYTALPNTTPIHKTCAGFIDTLERGRFVNSFFLDTILYQRDYWYHTIIYLPYTCGKWQIHRTRRPVEPSFTWMFSGNVYSYSSIGLWHTATTNSKVRCLSTVTTQASNTGLKPDGQSYSTSPLIQFSNLQPNKMPHYLSLLDYRCPTYNWINIPLNAVDPEGDSLVFTSIEGLTLNRAIPYRG